MQKSWFHMVRNKPNSLGPDYFNFPTLTQKPIPVPFLIFEPIFLWSPGNGSKLSWSEKVESRCSSSRSLSRTVGRERDPGYSIIVKVKTLFVFDIRGVSTKNRMKYSWEYSICHKQKKMGRCIHHTGHHKSQTRISKPLSHCSRPYP